MAMPTNLLAEEAALTSGATTPGLSANVPTFGAPGGTVPTGAGIGGTAAAETAAAKAAATKAATTAATSGAAAAKAPAGAPFPKDSTPTGTAVAKPQAPMGYTSGSTGYLPTGASTPGALPPQTSGSRSGSAPAPRSRTSVLASRPMRAPRSRRVGPCDCPFCEYWRHRIGRDAHHDHHQGQRSSYEYVGPDDEGSSEDDYERYSRAQPGAYATGGIPHRHHRKGPHAHAHAHRGHAHGYGPVTAVNPSYPGDHYGPPGASYPYGGPAQKPWNEYVNGEIICGPYLPMKIAPWYPSAY
jgi:hypothetical protein